MASSSADKDQGGLVFVVLSCLCASLWVIYVSFYHSRVLGFILTRLINFKYIEDGQYFKIGKFKNNFTMTAEIRARSLANFYCQYADRHEFETRSTR